MVNLGEGKEVMEVDDLEEEVEEQSPPESSSMSEEGEEAPAGSALEENIRRRGQNSYYYAHSKRINAPAWDGNSAPRLLNKEKLVVDQRPPQRITSYAWGDEKEKIKIYITLAQAEDMSDEDIKLDWTSTSLNLRVGNAEGSTHVLIVDRLYDEITEASFRKKKEKITVTLKKKGSMTWFDLRKAV